MKGPVLESLFDKVASLHTSCVIKKRVQNRRFLVKFPKFFRAPFNYFVRIFSVLAKRMSIRILEALPWLQRIYFLITIAFWFVKMLTLN